MIRSKLAKLERLLEDVIPPCRACGGLSRYHVEGDPDRPAPCQVCGAHPIPISTGVPRTPRDDGEDA